jgi:heme/copper-type cytochrome/quinol oxidase subunit 3
MLIATAMNLACLVLRFYEFPALKTRWDSHAYGSVVWVVLGLHMVHLVASIGENTVLTVYAFLRDIDEKHQLDLAVNSVYWYFVVASWIPIYVVVYFAPRWLN